MYNALMNVAVLFLLVAQAQPTVELGSVELDPKTKPFEPIAYFKGKSHVTVSEYRWQHPDTGKPMSTRVYRYTYRADFDSEAKLWAKQFPKSEGWAIEESKPKCIMGRQVKKKEVSYQALILQPGKLVYDAKVKSRSRAIPEPGWVRVSYNEQLTRAPW